jgi:hypothetical protein
MQFPLKYGLSIIAATSLILMAGCSGFSVRLETPVAQMTQSVPAPSATAGSTPTVSGDVPLALNRTGIHFAAGATCATVTTQLTSGAAQAYQMNLTAGQKLYITQNGHASLQLYGTKDQMITGITNAPGPWGVMVPADGAYKLAIEGAGELTFSVYAPPGGGSQTPAPIPASLERISFSAGATAASLQTDLVQGTPYGYVMTVQANQAIQISLSGNATLALLDLQGDAMPPVIPVSGEWQFAPTQQSGDYDLILMGEGPVSLKITIPPPSTNTGSPQVTLSQNGQTISVQVGDTFLLDLGNNYDWQIVVDHPEIVSRVVNIIVVRGAQGVYKALASGSAQLTATGDPTCRQSKPPCAAPSLLFKLNIVVS